LFTEINKGESKVPALIKQLHDCPNLPKPTYIPSNDFLWPFQEIVNTYGIPRYQEINPTYFNIVTFPFLFGVMFGDIGHGLVLFILGIYLCWNAEKIKQDSKSMLKIAIKARYLILLMGFFAFYAGWIYNDFLSMPLPIFPTCYENKAGKIPYAIKKYPSCVYPFGFDSKWKISKNELSYVNSFKMKSSVILGVSQMILGLILKGFNEIHFSNTLGFIFEFIPQIIFMSILFGYMNAMIFIKWLSDFSLDTKKAPSLISQMMGIFLKFGSVVN
jgi:V-type H+-transporting ATPase subunit a